MGIPRLSESPTYSAPSQPTRSSQSNDSSPQTTTSPSNPAPASADHSSDPSEQADTWPSNAHLPKRRRPDPANRIPRRTRPTRRLPPHRRPSTGQRTTGPSDRPTICKCSRNPRGYSARRDDGRRAGRRRHGPTQHFQRGRRPQRHTPRSLQNPRNNSRRERPLPHYILATVPDLV